MGKASIRLLSSAKMCVGGRKSDLFWLCDLAKVPGKGNEMG